MTRVLLVHQPVDGGVGRHVRDLALGLCERGHEVILCGPDLPFGGGGEPSAIRNARLDLVRAVRPRQDLGAILQVSRAVAQLRPDVVHAHSSKAGAVARVARAANLRTPVVYTPHLYAFAGDFDSARERRAYRLLERGLAPMASRVICVCEDEARLARSIGPTGRVRVVYNGVANVGEGASDPRIAAIREQSGLVVGALAVLSRRKGIQTLIEALPAVLRAHPQTRLVVAGDGPQLPELRDTAKHLGVSGAVSFLGAADDPIAVLRGLDVFVLPSWAESFPYVVLEAMAVGLPIVASDVGGVGEAIGDSGTLVRPRDATALAHELIALLGDRERRERLSARAQERQRAQFTLAGMVEATVATYAELATR